MTREETIKIMAVLKAAYPNFYKGMTSAEANGIVALWNDMLNEFSYTVVSAAVKSLIAADSKGYPPVIGQVLEKCRKITQPQEMTEGDAWALVSKAIRNSAYEAGKEFDALPENIQRLVGSPSQLYDWSQMDSDTVHSVVASNFQRSYRARQAADREYNALPSEVKAMIGGVADRLALEG